MRTRWLVLQNWAESVSCQLLWLYYCWTCNRLCMDFGRIYLIFFFFIKVVVFADLRFNILYVLFKVFWKVSENLYVCRRLVSNIENSSIPCMKNLTISQYLDHIEMWLFRKWDIAYYFGNAFCNLEILHYSQDLLFCLDQSHWVYSIWGE